VPPSTRGPYLQGSWLAPKPISLISFKHQNLFWCSISDKHLEVALNLLAYRLKGCRLPRSYCSPTKLHVSLRPPSTNRSLGVRFHLTTSTNWWRPIRSSELHSIYIYIPLKTINQFEFNTCWIANVYVLNILSYNEKMKHFFYFIPYMYKVYKYTHLLPKLPSLNTGPNIFKFHIYLSYTWRPNHWNKKNMLVWPAKLDGLFKPNSGENQTQKLDCASLLVWPNLPQIRSNQNFKAPICCSALVSNTWS